MNFCYMRLLTEFLTWLKELNLVEFLFSCYGCVSRVVWGKIGFRVRIRCLSVLQISDYVRFWKMIFGMGET